MYATTTVAGVVSTALTHPFEFMKTKIQVYNEGIGIRQKGLEAGYNMYRVVTQFYDVGYGLRSIYTGLAN